MLDGWGYSPRKQYNAIAHAPTPTWDDYWKTRPKSLLNASETSVGLPTGQMGNSEVGHMTIGAGRVIEQDLTRIDREIKEGAFKTNDTLTQLYSRRPRVVHLVGLLSPGGVHSHIDHFISLIDVLADRGIQVSVHAILDGRDTPPKSAANPLEIVESHLQNRNCGQISSISGRYYAMDRDRRWDRTKLAYDMYVEAIAPNQASNPSQALEDAYTRGESDEFVKPTLITGGATFSDEDAVIFMNFRADRVRQLCRALILDDFVDFDRPKKPALLQCIFLTPYARDIDSGSDRVPVEVLFQPESIRNTLGGVLAEAGRTQLRIAETEKYAHVTFFFSGGRESTFTGEDREFIPSPKVATYDLQPGMSSAEISESITKVIKTSTYDFVIANLANGDMVGHTGNFDAAIKACIAIDKAIAKIGEAVLETGANCLITADHGNIECLLDSTQGQPHTAHTLNLVPLIYIGNKPITLKSRGTLADIAPTMLDLAEMSIPPEMDGRSLVT